MGELAPGSPGNTTLLLIAAPIPGRWPILAPSRGGHEGTHPLEVFPRVDAERHAVDHCHVDAHAGLEGAQLLEAFAPLEPRRRQRDEPFERAAAIRIEADVMIERAV